MRYLSVCLFVSLGTYGLAQTNLFVHPDAEAYVSQTKTVAIMPISTTFFINPLDYASLSDQDIPKIEKEMAYEIQKSMHSWFLKRGKRGKVRVSIQSINQTNEILKNNNIDPLTESNLSIIDLCEMLGVDALVVGNLETDKLLPDFVSVGIIALEMFNILPSSEDTPLSNTATLSLQIFHSNGELVVDYFKHVEGRLGSSQSSLINKLMRKTTRRIPYTM
ncbi:MAG: hypothetical protein OXC61_05075 [Flavobacteriaceae bacterium]|nr:hypothetical protein [Flavobacteriaceae bacterium]